MEGPWKGSGFENIDLCIQSLSDDNPGMFLVDAKYADRKSTPSSGYQYQQFFYAVAWAAKKRPLSAMALAHPASNAEEEGRESDSYDLEEYISAFINKGQIPFKIWTIKFPQPSDLRRSGLEDYLITTNSRLRELLEETPFSSSDMNISP